MYKTDSRRLELYLLITLHVSINHLFPTESQLTLIAYLNITIITQQFSNY